MQRRPATQGFAPVLVQLFRDRPTNNLQHYKSGFPLRFAAFLLAVNLEHTEHTKKKTQTPRPDQTPFHEKTPTHETINNHATGVSQRPQNQTRNLTSCALHRNVWLMGNRIFFCIRTTAQVRDSFHRARFHFSIARDREPPAQEGGTNSFATYAKVTLSCLPQQGTKIANVFFFSSAL